MCGIAGILSLTGTFNAPNFAPGTSGASAALLSMIGHISHRGPDDQGLYVSRAGGTTIELGHTRLSIIDTSPAGHQPMIADDPETVITYNGEVYNFKQLRSELGTKWRSQTDTEAILKAYQRWGVACLERLRGMFALAVWDSEEKSLLLARDRFGIKPLYYYSDGGNFLFASEVRALLSSGLVPRKLDPQGVLSYFRTGAIEAPLTIVDGVKCLAPGHCLKVWEENGRIGLEESKYADCLGLEMDVPKPTNRNEAIDVLRGILEESVRLHLLSDVPLAVFLSGGIDSSAILAIVRALVAAPARTFTVVFEEEEFSERTYARLVASKFGAEHQEIHLTEQSCFEMIPRAISSMDQPTIDGINTFVIAGAVREAGIVVSLSGLGGDELFGGYPSFRRVRRFRHLSHIPASLRTTVANAGKSFLATSVNQRKAWQFLAAGDDPKAIYTTSRQLFSDSEIKAFVSKDIRLLQDARPAGLPHLVDQGDVLNEVSLYELTGYMSNMLLRDADQMGMAHSLEIRVPFVDPVVAHFVMNLPGEWKLDGGRPKPMLLDALGDLIPEQVWRRPKMGFTLPFEKWLLSALRPDIEDSMKDASSLSALGLSDQIQPVWQAFLGTPGRERWSRPWSVHVLKKWCEINAVQL